jgi:hypothetical protein
VAAVLHIELAPQVTAHLVAGHAWSSRCEPLAREPSDHISRA